MPLKTRDSDFPKTTEFKEKIQSGKSLDEILPEAFALVRRHLRERGMNVILMCS